MLSEAETSQTQEEEEMYFTAVRSG